MRFVDQPPPKSSMWITLHSAEVSVECNGETMSTYERALEQLRNGDDTCHREEAVARAVIKQRRLRIDHCVFTAQDRGNGRCFIKVFGLRC